MSSATWRNVFTYVSSLSLRSHALTDCALVACRYNKYTQIAARAVRQSLKESERVAAEKRGLTILRYQHWENGVGGAQVSHYRFSGVEAFINITLYPTQTYLVPPEEKEPKQGVV